ncbi:MAG TPA: citrate/2-methylcitrate synthase [Gaiellaceae bacterium]|nr:citrate/2-methylcitrate synthase [Gaiellaceae bacterium]
MDDRTAAFLRQTGLIPTAAAARTLGVKTETLYAYVSRGLLTAHRASDSRESFFAPSDLRRLQARPRRAAPSAPVSSAITLSRSDGIYYRGENVLELARTSTFEDVASRLWQVEPGEELRWVAPPDAVKAARAAQARLPDATLPLDRVAAMIPVVAAHDPFRNDLSPPTVRRAAATLITALVHALPKVSAGQGRVDGIAASLARRLSRRPTARLVDGLDLALVLVADHGLAASTLAARVAANTRAPIYSSVQAAVAALQGPRHGFATPWAEELLAEVATGRSVDVVVEEHLRRGESLWYSGYEAGGDPRAEFLLEETLRLASPTRTRTITKLLRFAETHAMPPAGAEFAFAAFAHGFGLVRGGGQAIFAVGRTAGWVAHAIEEHASPSPLRMRAAYVGPDPADPE